MRTAETQASHGRVRVVDTGKGPAIVLMHGLGGSWQNWLENIPALARRHRVIAMDLPGFGQSEQYAGDVTVQRYSDTVVEVLDQLGVEQATFVGNSLGGLLTIETAVRHPERVAAAVLVCSGGVPLKSLRHRLITIPQAKVMNRLLRLRGSVWLVRRSHRVRLFLGVRVFHNPKRMSPDVLSTALVGLGAPGFGPAFVAGADYDARTSAPLMSCPTLIVWGSEDPLLPVAMGRELRRRIPVSSLEVWEGIGHCPMLEDPARFNARVVDFVGEQVGGRGD